MLSHYTNNASNEINYFIEDRERFELSNSGFAVHPLRPLRHLSNLILSRGESICRLLLESCGLLTIVHTVTTRKPDLIFVSPKRFELLTPPLKVECSNPAELRRQIWKVTTNTFHGEYFNVVLSNYT